MNQKQRSTASSVLVLLGLIMLGIAIASVSLTALLFYLAAVLLWLGFGVRDAGKKGGDGK